MGWPGPVHCQMVQTGTRKRKDLKLWEKSQDFPKDFKNQNLKSQIIYIPKSFNVGKDKKHEDESGSVVK